MQEAYIALMDSALLLSCIIQASQLEQAISVHWSQWRLCFVKTSKTPSEKLPESGHVWDHCAMKMQNEKMEKEEETTRSESTAT